jgi:hypothetical protein
MHGACESAAVGWLALIVYARTLCRTVYVGDSGELIAAVHTLGIPHPPGYPLYVILGKAFSVLVAKGNPALRANLFSACCAATSVSIWFLIFQNAGIPTGIAAAGSLAVAFGSSLWSQATVARAYAPAALAITLIFLFFTRWIQNPPELHWLAWALAITGAGIAIHPLVGVALPGLIAAVALRRPNLFHEIRSLEIFACILPGLLTYAWIPLRARAKPLVRWGNLQTRRDLLRFFFRGEYWKYRYVRSLRQAVRVIAFYCYRFTNEYGLLGAAATVVGIPLLARASSPLLAMAITVAVANAISMIAHARRHDIFFWPRYMIGAWLALALPMVFGWAWLLAFLPSHTRGPAAFLLPLVLFLTRFRHRDLSRHRYAEEYSARVLRSLPPNAILIADDDNVLFPLMYLHHVLKLRPDVTLIDGAARDAGPLIFNPRRDAVYCTHHQAAFVRPPTDRDAGSNLVAEGLVYRVVSNDMNYTPPNLWPDAFPPDMDDESIPRDFMTRCLLANVCIMRAQWESQQQDPTAAEAWCIKATKLGWDCDVVQHNAAVLLSRQGSTDLAAQFLAAASRIERNEGRWSDQTG